MSDHTPHSTVVALAYDGLCTFEFGCAYEIFGLPRPELDQPWYRFEVCAAEPGPLRAAGALAVRAPHDLDLIERADTVVVPGWRGPDHSPSPALLDALARVPERGGRLVSICSGVFVLAAAGVLDGRRATTHWRYTGTLGSALVQLSCTSINIHPLTSRSLVISGCGSFIGDFLHVWAEICADAWSTGGR